MDKTQRKLLECIKSKKRLLSEEEIIDFYIRNSCRGTCHIISTINGERTLEDRLWQIKKKAKLTYTYALGRLVQSGHFVIADKEF